MIVAIEGKEYEVPEEVGKLLLAVSLERDDLKTVPEDSIEAKLFKIIDDIDTGLDQFKPNMDAFEKFVSLKCRTAHEIITSDGYKLFYV